MRAQASERGPLGELGFSTLQATMPRSRRGIVVRGTEPYALIRTFGPI